MIAATGFATGEHAIPELATAAVKSALAKADSNFAHSVILLLSGHFIRHAHPAIAAASRAANCLQVCGCTVPGLFTEQDQSLDQPAVAALILCGPVSLGLPQAGQPRLSFVVPSQLKPEWVSDGNRRFGTIATVAAEARKGQRGAEGQVWAQGKLNDGGRVEMAFHGGSLSLGISRGVKPLTPLLEVTDSDNFEILQLGEQTALDSLLRQLDPDIRKLDELPQQRIFAALPESGIDPELAMQHGRYSLLPILRVNRDERSVTLAAPLPLHAKLGWVLREPAVAEQDMRTTLENVAASATAPAFGLLFSCIGRGPYFYQGHDRDVAAMRERFPGIPLLGAYGAGEIAPTMPFSTMISYSSVIALVSHDV